MSFLKESYCFIACIIVVCYAHADAGGKMVVAEKFTGVWCPYCPSAAKGLDELDKLAGDSLIVISHHFSGETAVDPFYIPANRDRALYYGLKGLPTVIFNGKRRLEGGLESGSLYPQYRTCFDDVKKDCGPLEITLSFGNNRVRGDIKNSSNDMIHGTLYFFIVERHIPYKWLNMNEVDFLSRALLPNGKGRPVSIAAQTNLTQSETVTVSDQWNKNNLYAICFVQGPDSVIYQGARIKIAVSDIAVPCPAIKKPLSMRVRYDRRSPSPSVAIDFIIPHRAEIKVTICNVLGKTVYEFSNDIYESGNHTLIWNRRNTTAGLPVPAGTYVCLLKSGSIIRAERILVLQ